VTKATLAQVHARNSSSNLRRNQESGSSLHKENIPAIRNGPFRRVGEPLGSLPVGFGYCLLVFAHCDYARPVKVSGRHAVLDSDLIVVVLVALVML